MDMIWHYNKVHHLDTKVMGAYLINFFRGNYPDLRKDDLVRVIVNFYFTEEMLAIMTINGDEIYSGG